MSEETLTIKILPTRYPFSKSKRRKFRKQWKEIGERLVKLPEIQQMILLDDFLTAIQSRLAFMERITPPIES